MKKKLFILMALTMALSACGVRYNESSSISSQDSSVSESSSTDLTSSSSDNDSENSSTSDSSSSSEIEDLPSIEESTSSESSSTSESSNEEDSSSEDDNSSDPEPWPDSSTSESSSEENNPNPEPDVDPTPRPSLNTVKTNINHPNETMYEPELSFKDARYDYYRHNLGCIENATLMPTKSGASIFNWNGQNNMSEFSVNTIDEIAAYHCLDTKVKSAINLKTTQASILPYGDVTINVTNEPIEEQLVGNAKTNYVNGFLNSHGGKDLYTTNETVNSVVSNLNNLNRDFSLLFSDSDAFGYYRFVPVVNISIYANFVFDTLTTKTRAELYFLASKPSIVLEYCKDNDDFLPLDTEVVAFNFDAAKTRSYEAPERYYDFIWEKARAKGFDDGEGTLTNPYVISGIVKPALEQFKLIDNFRSSHFILNTDIDFSGLKMSSYGPIINGIFTGSFEGNNHTFKNLKWDIENSSIKKSSNPEFDLTYKLSLFDRVDGAIRNLTIKDFHIFVNSNHDGSDWYGYSFLASTGYGSFMNITVDHGYLNTNRDISSTGFLLADFRGYMYNCKVTNNSYIFANGDLGGLVAYCYGKIVNCVIENSKISYYLVYNARSFGGICSNLRDDNYGEPSMIDDSGCYTTTFILHASNEMTGFWGNQVKHHAKCGEIVGHAHENTSIWNVFGSTSSPWNNVHTCEYGKAGDYFFRQGWGFAGKLENGVTVK